MSQNRTPGGGVEGERAPRSTGVAGTGSTSTDPGATRDAGGGGDQGMTTTGQGAGNRGGGQGAGAATAMAQDYGQKIADVANTARDYVSDKVGVVGDKLKDLQNVDINQVANQAKDYARQNPGQAILVSAAAGFVIGLLLRGSRR
jgi:ElaB/YqjD/DUF883 family membrane-anchored ribosome-binding protein